MSKVKGQPSSSSNAKQNLRSSGNKIQRSVADNLNIKKTLTSRRDFMDYTPEDLQHLPQDALDYLSKFISETVHYDFRHTNHIHNESQRKALYRENNTRKEDIYRTIQRTTFDSTYPRNQLMLPENEARHEEYQM